MTTNEFLASAWGWHPVVMAVGVTAAAWGWRARAGWQFFAAVGLFYLTLASPLDALANGYLFSAHMLQHLLLLLIVPALAAFGWPERRGDDTRGVAHPMVGWAAGVGAMWIWHERTLCNFATTTQTVRVVQIVSLLAMGWMFWQPIIGPRAEQRLPSLLGVVYLFSACVACTILGVLITFAPVGVVCPIYLHPVDRLGILPLIREQWGLTPKLDQQAGGLLMWVPACGIYLTGIMGLFGRWYRASEAGEPGFVGGRAAGGNI